MLLPWAPPVTALLAQVRALPKLRILVIGLLMSFQSIGYGNALGAAKGCAQMWLVTCLLHSYVMLMVFLLFYLWAVVGVIFLAENDPFNFGNLHLAFLALWRSATGDDWTDMMYTAFYGCKSHLYGGGADYGGHVDLCKQGSDAMVREGRVMVVSSSGGANYCTNVCQGLIFPTFYFIVFQVLASMMLINMFIGAILMSVEEAKDDLTNTEMLVVKFVKARRLPKVSRGLLKQDAEPVAFVRMLVRERAGRCVVSAVTCVSAVWACSAQIVSR